MEIINQHLISKTKVRCHLFHQWG